MLSVWSGFLFVSTTRGANIAQQFANSVEDRIAEKSQLCHVLPVAAEYLF
jgi:hypothetical protein